MEFTSITGSEIYLSFDYGIKEDVIEKLYGEFFNKVNKNITYTKEYLGIGRTDGIIRFYDENGNFLFWVLQETKRDVSLTSVWYGRSILQSLMYLSNVYYDINTLDLNKFKGVFLDSAQYFVYFPKKCIDPLMVKFEPLWNKYYRVRPSEAYNVPELEDFIPIARCAVPRQYKYYLTDKSFRLDVLIKDLYENKI